MKPTLSMNSNHVMVRELKDYLMIALGMIFYGIGWTVFLLPNDLPSGAVPGIASIVYWGTGLPVQYTYFAINALLLLLSLYHGKEKRQDENGIHRLHTELPTVYGLYPGGYLLR